MERSRDSFYFHLFQNFKKISNKNRIMSVIRINKRKTPPTTDPMITVTEEIY